MRLFIDDKAANIKDVCTLIGIKENDIPFNIKSKNFERIGVRGRRDPQTNQPLVPRGHGIPCQINISTASGDVVKITYSEHQKNQNKNGVSQVIHTPMNLMIEGLTLSLREDEKVKFFYTYIHPFNRDSPLNIGKPNPHCIYEFVNNGKTAKEENDKEDQVYDAMTKLKSLGDLEVKQIAKGYKMDGIDDLTDAEVRKLLRNKLKLNPVQFMIDLEDNQVALDGIIKDSIDKGIITFREIGLSKLWSIGDQEICATQNGTNELNNIRTQIESNLDMYMPLIENGIKTKESTQALKKPEAAKWFDKFKAPTQDAPGYTAVDSDIQKNLAQAKLEDARVAKLREWYNTDINGDNHHSVIAALKKNKVEIMEQFNKDKADGVIPADRPVPILELQTA